MRVRPFVSCFAFAGLVLVFGRSARAQNPPPSAPTPYTSPYLATPFDLATWEKSKQTTRTFTVPEPLAPHILAKAQTLIANWRERNKARQIMKLQAASGGGLETRPPTDALHFGLAVTTQQTAQGREFTVRGLTYPGSTFSLAGDPKETDKRADLLAFLLQEAARELEGAPPSVPPPPVTVAASAPKMTEKTTEKRGMRPDVDALLTSIRSLLEAGQTDAALEQLERLKVLLKKDMSKP